MNPNPTAVVLADLTGAVSPSGAPILDLIATDAAANTVVIFKGRLGGGFESAPALILTLPAGASPAAVLAANLNGDAKPDLIVVNSGLTAASGESVSVFLNNAPSEALSFGARSSVNGGEHPIGAALANFDGDANNQLDLAVADGAVNGAGNFTVTILLGNGAGGFGSPTSVKVGDGVPNAAELISPSSLAAGDLNGDSKPDLVVGGGNGTAVLRNTTAAPGLPTFSALAARLTNSVTTSVAVGSLNADMVNDIAATTTANGGQVLTFRNDGASPPNFIAAPFAAGPAPTAIRLSDVSADGLLDVILVNDVVVGAVGTLRNDGGPAISLASETTRQVGPRPAGLAIGDTNQDGVPDTVTSNGGDGTLTLLESSLPPSRNLVISGTGGAAAIHIPDANGTFGSSPEATLTPFEGYLGDVRTAAADIDGDGIPDTILVTGPGTPIRVAVISGADNSTLLVAPFDPFGGDFTGGGFVAAGDIDHDGRAEFFVTPDRGGGPRVSIFSLLVGGRTTRANFFGIDDSSFRGGCRAALGDVNGDGVPDLAVAAGFLGGPRTALFNGTTLIGGKPTRIVNDFFAFPGSDALTLRNGTFVTVGDINGDGFADLIFGGGPGGAPRVFILSGATVTGGDVAAAQTNPIANFFVAGNSSDRGGVRVAAKEVDGDNRADLAVGSGEGSPANARIYLGKNFTGGGEPVTFQDLSILGGLALTDGVFVG